MALVMFSCRATGPFIMFQESVERIFEIIGRPFAPEGAFAADELPEILEKIEESMRKDKEAEAADERAREEANRTSTYDPMREEIEAEEEKKRCERVRLYQRLTPLAEMLRRAIRHDEPVMWGRP